jgi:hypothetical protein
LVEEGIIGHATPEIEERRKTNVDQRKYLGAVERRAPNALLFLEMAQLD